MEQKTSIVLVPVVYNNPEECRRYINSVLLTNLSDIQLTIIVADNSTVNNSSFFEFPVADNVRAIYHHTQSNLGYMNAGNAMYELFVKDKMQYDLFIISNTDLLIHDPSFFQLLAEKNKYISSDVFLLAPYVESSLTGRNLNPQLLQKPGRPYVQRVRFFYGTPLMYNALVCLSWLKHKYARTVVTYRDDTAIYAPHGSIFIFRKSFFDAGGNARFPYFLFGEEIFIAEQVCRLDGKILYLPDLKLVHHEHTSTGLFKWGKKFNAIRQVRENMLSLYGY